MIEALNQKALTEAIAQTTSELTENWTDICQMRDLAAINYAKSGATGRFTFKTAVSISQEPMGDKVLVKAGISCSAGLKSEHDTRMIDMHPELDMGE